MKKPINKSLKEWPIRDKIKDLVEKDRQGGYGKDFIEMETRILSHIEKDTRAAFEAFLRRLMVQVKYAIREGEDFGGLR